MTKRWFVQRDVDSGSHVYSKELLEEHAKRLAAVMNDIEDERVARLGGSRAAGDGHFYTAMEQVEKTASAAAKVLRDPKSSRSAKAAAASALTQKIRR